MICYAYAGQNVQVIDDTDGEFIPDTGMIAMQYSRPEGSDTLLYTAQPDGTWAITEITIRGVAAKIEDEWRAAEMPIARENVTAIEFGDDTIPGTAAQWKAYWLALRAWTEGAEGYPDATHRPVQPT